MGFKDVLLLVVLLVILCCLLVRLVYDAKPKYVLPMLAGGLGNRIFQVFAAMHYAEKYGRTLAFSKQFVYFNPGETVFDEVCRIFPDVPILEEGVVEDFEHLKFVDKPLDYEDLPYTAKDVVLEGWFQNYKYIPAAVLANPPIRKSPALSNTYFIHVRAGDYLNHPLHFIDLRKYYARCIDLIKADDPKATFLVFSDDNTYAANMLKEFDVKYSISQTKSAYDTLNDMSACSGGICANSSLSWLGSMFQATRRHIYMPSKWFNDVSKQTIGIYPPWAIVVPV